MSAKNSAAPAPKHLRAIGLLGLLWSAMGAMDFVMTLTRNEEWLENFSPGQLAFLDAYAPWQTALWGGAVWGGLLGCMLLIIRSRRACPMLLLSFACMLATTINNYVFGSAMEHFGSPGLLAFTALIFLISLGLWRYAAAMGRKGLL